MPIIIFYRGPEGIWTLKNVGEGTAQSVFMKNYLDEGKALDEVELYPIVPNQEIRLNYLKGAGKLVARYTNILGQDPHYTVCVRDANNIHAGEWKDNATAPTKRGHESRTEEWPVTRLS